MAMIRQVNTGEGVALTLPDGTEALVFLHEIRSTKQVSLRIHAPREVKIGAADDRFDSIEEGR